MPIPALADSKIDRDSPLDESVMKTGLKDRDDWLWDEATNGGSGIEPNVSAFASAFGTAGHSHDGTDGQGANIDTAGIDDDAASQESMFVSNAVTSAKIAANTLPTADFATGACTVAKMSGTMGTNVASSQAYDTAQSPTGINVIFLGDRVSVSNPKGAIGVIVRPKPTTSTFGGGSNRVDFWVVEQTASNIILGFDYVAGQHDAAGNWGWDFYVV